jgi:hypothetical protein
MTHTDIWMIGLTALIAVAGFVSATIFNNQLTVMQGQLREMKSTGTQTDRLIEMTKDTADAARLSARTARETLIYTQRAILTVVAPYNVRIQNEGQPIIGYAFQIYFKNSGPTTAKQTRIVFKVEYIDRVLPDNYDYSFAAPPELNNSPPADIGRDTEFRSEAMSVAMNAIQSVQNGQGTLLQRFYISYNDIFEGTDRHHLAGTISTAVIRDPLLVWPEGRDQGPFKTAVRWISAD